MDEIMLRIDNVSKKYKLGQIGGTTLRDELQRKMAKLKGKEDPTRRIGAKNYNQGETFMALDGISFDVKKGERVGIIGHNGAGKSTLLKLISRVTAPTGGKIQMNGRVASMLEVGTGFHGELTGRENIYMNGAILGMTKKEIDAKMEDIIEFSEVRQFIDTPVKRYSSGMYVKLAFSVAAHLDSEIMIMDEVLAVGDMAFQKKCLDKMNDVSKTQGRTILYVSHNMNTIRQLCDRVVVLDHGKVVFDGGVEEGIEIYFGNSMSLGNQKILEFPLEKHEFCNMECMIEQIEFENETASYVQGEDMHFKLYIRKSKNNSSKYYLRVMIRSSVGTVVAMASTENELNLNKTEGNTCNYAINLKDLAPANYMISYVIYEIGDLGANKNIDILRDVYSLSITSSQDFNHGMEWLPQYWGYYTGAKLKEIT